LEESTCKSAGRLGAEFFTETCSRALWQPTPGTLICYLRALAETSQTEFLVTGDKQRLALKPPKSTKIVAPVAMIEILKAGNYFGLTTRSWTEIRNPLS